MKSQGKLDHRGLTAGDDPPERDGTSVNDPRIVRVYGWRFPAIRASIRGAPAFTPEMGRADCLRGPKGNPFRDGRTSRQESRALSPDCRPSRKAAGR